MSKKEVKNDMNMKEKVLEVLKGLGFQLEDLDGVAYGFGYEDKHFLYLPDNDDDSFLSIGVHLLPITGNLEHIPEEIVLAFNSAMKYVKVYKFFEGLWLFYEREMFEGENLDIVLRAMILHLEASIYHFKEVFPELFSEADEDESEVENVDEDEDLEEKEEVEDEEA